MYHCTQCSPRATDPWIVQDQVHRAKHSQHRAGEWETDMCAEAEWQQRVRTYGLFHIREDAGSIDTSHWQQGCFTRSMQ